MNQREQSQEAGFKRGQEVVSGKAGGVHRKRSQKSGHPCKGSGEQKKEEKGNILLTVEERKEEGMGCWGKRERNEGKKEEREAV